MSGPAIFGLSGVVLCIIWTLICNYMIQKLTDLQIHELYERVKELERKVGK